MSAAQDAKRLRANLDGSEYPRCVVGNVGGCEVMLANVLDRLDELEWIVSVMRGLTPVSPPPEPQP